MTRTKFGLVGLCAVALGLMAFSTAAQATTGSKWLILTSGGVLKEGSTLHALVGLVKDTPTLILHSEILKIEALFVCTEVKAVNAKLLANGSIGKEEGVVSGSKILFSGCITELNLKPAPECTPIDPTDGSGFIVTKPGHALLILGASGEELVKTLPDVVAPEPEFARIALPAPCPIGTSVPVIGKFNFKDCENKAKTHLVKHLIEEGPGSGLFTISLTAEHAATLLGSAWAFLENVGAEVHEGLKWSGDQI